MNESQLRKIVKKSINKVLKENEEYMSDTDIAAQYDDFKITYFTIKPLKHSEGYEGVIEIEFPNANDIDFNSSLVENYFVYDKDGKRIAFENWYPDYINDKLINLIRNKINKLKK